MMYLFFLNLIFLFLNFFLFHFRTLMGIKLQHKIPGFLEWLKLNKVQWVIHTIIFFFIILFCVFYFFCIFFFKERVRLELRLLCSRSRIIKERLKKIKRIVRIKNMTRFAVLFIWLILNIIKLYTLLLHSLMFLLYLIREYNLKI